MRSAILLLGLAAACEGSRFRQMQHPCGNIQCPGGFVPLCTKKDAPAGGGAWCVPDKQAVQPYGMTTHEMIKTEGADPTLTAAEWAEKAKAAYAWHASGGGSQFLQGQKFVPAPPELPTTGGYNAVSTTMKCVINLTIQYMIIYSALAVARTVSDAFGWEFKSVPITNILKQCTHTINYCPMAACMFLAIRMRVIWLSHGAEWDPQDWVCVCMQYVAWSILATTLVVAIIPLFTGELVPVKEDTGDLDENATPKAFQGIWAAALGFTIFRYLLLLGMYGGMIGVIWGTFTYMPANGQWRPMAPAVGATVTLTIMFFIVYAGGAILRTFGQLTGNHAWPALETALLAATAAMNFAPMLSILFMAARMRALQMDSVNGAPQGWAQSCFYMCAYAVMFQTILSVAVPLVMGGTVKKGTTEGDMEYTVENKTLGLCLTVGRYIIMLSIYLGFTAVVVSIFTLEHPDGAQYTPPISPTVQCVLNLTFQFFFIYLMVWACISLREWTNMEWPLLTNTMESCMGTVAFCPMLAILFVGTRMRALQMTNNKGAPQGWAQDGMYLATWSIFVQFFMVVIAGVATGEKVKTDADGNATWHPTNIYLWYGVQVVRWFAVLALWGGAITVIISVFTITPETANGRGAIPLVTDGTVPVVGDQLAGPPPGAQNLPGMEPGGAAGDVMAPAGSAGEVMKTAGDTATDPAGAVSF